MAKQRKGTPSAPAETSAAASPSELAALVHSLKDARRELAILGDFLEEKLGLRATADLFRLPEFQQAPTRPRFSGTFSYYPLTHDVFLWLTEGYCMGEGRTAGVAPCTLVGLYAHPEGQLARWAKITAEVVGPPDPGGTHRRPWDIAVKPDPRIDVAKRELAAAARSRKR